MLWTLESCPGTRIGKLVKFTIQISIILSPSESLVASRATWVSHVFMLKTVVPLGVLGKLLERI